MSHFTHFIGLSLRVKSSLWHWTEPTSWTFILFFIFFMSHFTHFIGLSLGVKASLTLNWAYVLNIFYFPYFLMSHLFYWTHSEFKHLWHWTLGLWAEEGLYYFMVRSWTIIVAQYLHISNAFLWSNIPRKIKRCFIENVTCSHCCCSMCTTPWKRSLEPGSRGATLGGIHCCSVLWPALGVGSLRLPITVPKCTTYYTN